jgi:hypothetical protein
MLAITSKSRSPIPHAILSFQSTDDADILAARARGFVGELIRHQTAVNYSRNSRSNGSESLRPDGLCWPGLSPIHHPCEFCEMLAFQEMQWSLNNTV